jgi:hypothetical protein
MTTNQQVTKPPPESCNLCGGTIGSVFYDCLIPSVGSWGDICHSCFTSHRCSLGTGRGQKYKATTKGQPYTKIKG